MSNSQTIRIGEGKYAGNHNLAIQAAVDELAASGGGTVIIPKGVYKMTNAVLLKSGVNLKGEPGAVLRNEPNIEMRVPNYVGYGMYEFTVEHPRKLKPGMGFMLFDKGTFGFYNTAGTILKIDGDRVIVDHPLARDYHFKDEAMISTIHSVIAGDGVSDCLVEGLTLDGNASKITRVLNGCRGGGLYLIQSQRIVVKNVEVRNYKGDGVTFQACADIVIDGCHIHDNEGGGMHPGSGTVRYVMQNNVIHHNGGFGLFYCLRTSHSIARNNHIHHNHIAGISVGERDSHHLIESNLVEENGGAGVEFRPPAREGGDCVRLYKNTFRNNCGERSSAEVFIPAGLTQIVIESNVFEPRKGVARAVEVKPGDVTVFATGNMVDGRAQTKDDFVEPLNRKTDALDLWGAAVPTERKLPRIAGPAKNVKLSLPKKASPIGPMGLGLEGASHLRIPKLPEWSAWAMTVGV